MLLCSTICPEDDIEKKKISLGKEIPESVQEGRRSDKLVSEEGRALVRGTCQIGEKKNEVRKNTLHLNLLI